MESRDDPKTTAATEQDKVEVELDLLLGASIFGGESEPLTHVARPSTRDRVSWMRIGVTIGLLVFGAAVWVALHVGLRERAAKDCAKVVEDLAQYLRTGSLDALTDILPVAHALARDAERETELRDLFVRADATLYRYHDAAEDRRERVLAVLGASSETPSTDLVVARALVASDAERVDMIAIFERARPEGRDPELAFLLATALDAAGQSNAASRAYAQSIDIEPSHLGHQYAFAAHRARAGQAFDARRIVEQMEDVSPKSPWTSLARRELDAVDATDDKRVDDRVAISHDDWPAVPHALWRLQDAIDRLRAGETDAGLREFDEAIAIVRRAPPFVLDAVGTLVATQQLDAAERVVDGSSWQSTRAGAREIARQIREARDLRRTAHTPPIREGNAPDPIATETASSSEAIVAEETEARASAASRQVDRKATRQKRARKNKRR